MAGRRHHTIPQFMLRAFESSKHGRESRVWCYRRDCEPIELSVTKIGVEKDFYGKELDDRITELESGFAPLADDLRASSGPVDKPEVADLFAHLTLRTQALRQSAIDLARKMTDRILCFLPCGAEPEGSVDLEGVLTVHSEVVAHVRDFSVLALLAWRADFDGDNATLRRLC